MIRAHIASFPPRRDLLLATVNRLLPQVDHIFVCLNEFDAVPDALLDDKITATIPEADLKDAGKFLHAPDPDDIVLTVDDDIAYPDSYVATLLKHAQAIDIKHNTIGYQANAWVWKKRHNTNGWRNFMFFNACKHVTSVDVLGTGTALMSGANTPPLEAMQSAAGYVDIRFAQWQRDNQTRLWTLPREAEYLPRNLPSDLEPSSLFNTVTRNPSAQMQTEIRNLIAGCTDTSGKRWDKVA